MASLVLADGRTTTGSAHATELVLRDLLDALIQENVLGVADRLHPPDGAVTPAATGFPLAEDEHWCHFATGRGEVRFRARNGGPLQRCRLARAPVWSQHADGSIRVLGPAELLAEAVEAVEAAELRVDEVKADLDAAVDHAAVTLAEFAALTDPAPRPGELLSGERLAASRNRPFHPTARAASGWSADELRRYGPMRREPLGMDWVAVRRRCLRHGGDPRSTDLAALVLDDADLALLESAARAAGIGMEEYQALPVHPWQLEQVLPARFGPRFTAADVVPLVRDLGRFHPTSSLRTLLTCPEGTRHLKLPLGVATLGAARLLPPRYLDNAERAQHTMATVISRDPTLGTLAELCDERTWCGWRDPDVDDDYEDLPGHLTAQVRRYPENLFADPGTVVLPMAALAAHEWDVLGPAVAAAGFDDDPLAVFGELAEAFCALAFSFLRYGVLPELHGQNVVVALAGGKVRRFVLRDHDTLRLYPGWMRAAGVPDPGYRIKPGAPQTLCLPDARPLLGYLQTLGFQVNLYGIADALARHHLLDERVLWNVLHRAVAVTLDRLDLPAAVASLLRAELLHARTWPSRQVLGPLLRAGRSAGVSMPAAVGAVPNPLLPSSRPPTGGDR